MTFYKSHTSLGLYRLNIPLKLKNISIAEGVDAGLSDFKF